VFLYCTLQLCLILDNLFIFVACDLSQTACRSLIELASVVRALRAFQSWYN